MKILIVGAAGMLGYTLLHALAAFNAHEIHGTIRAKAQGPLSLLAGVTLHEHIDVHNLDCIRGVAVEVLPDVIINCVGIIKQLDTSKSHLATISLNALLPHQLADIASSVGAKLIHFSTDCVFSGLRGNYSDNDVHDATDLYGKSKSLGEVAYTPHLTLRTSIIGHELASQHSLVDWFLSQRDTVRGFSKAIFSGLPTIEVARVLQEFVLPHPALTGVYNLGVAPIDKNSLLLLIKDQYGSPARITPYADFVIDRSLDSNSFREATGYKAPEWPELIAAMHADFFDAYANQSRRQFS